jgi:hypothetical protein
MYDEQQQSAEFKQTVNGEVVDSSVIFPVIGTLTEYFFLIVFF